MLGYYFLGVGGFGTSWPSLIGPFRIGSGLGLGVGFGLGVGWGAGVGLLSFAITLSFHIIRDKFDH